MSINEGMFTSTTDSWATPQWLFDAINNDYHFTVDVCASADNHKVDKYYTIEDNGLSQDWNNEVVWCNPPYGRGIGDWVKKAYDCDSTVVMLLPARTDTRWFQNYIYNNPDAEIDFIKGRLKFGDGNKDAPFPSMLVYFRRRGRHYA